jgi:transcriptional regulator with XRE-family HTH domain
MTPSELRAARKALGMTQHELAAALRMGKWGFQTVSVWEKDGSTVPGPVQVAVLAMLKEQDDA